MSTSIKEVTPCEMCLSSCCNDCNCCGGGQSLCIASSVSNFVIGKGTDTGKPDVLASVSVIIPKKSCITKIYASMPNDPKVSKYIRITVTQNTPDGAVTIFDHALPNESGEGVQFDTTLVQPLSLHTCDDIATAKVEAFNENNQIIDALKGILTLTVVYCTNCCNPATP